MRKFIIHTISLIPLVFFHLVWENTLAQCSNCTFGGTKYPSSALTPTACWQTQSGINGGTYAEFNVQQGKTYFFSYCTTNGGSASWDTRLVLFNGASYLTCNSDYGCTPSTAARIDWTATYTGVVRLRTLQYVSSANQCASSGTGAVLAYKQQCPTISTPTTPSPGSFTAPGPTLANSIKLQWNSPGSTHHVEVWDAVTGTQISLPTSADCINGNSYTLPSLPAGKYKWSVHRNEPCGCCDGPSTSELFFQVGANCTTPAPPANATVSNIGQTTANVSWIAGNPAGSPTVTYYWVIGTSPTVTYGNGIDEGTTTSTSASAKGLTCGTQYYLRVYAQSSCNGTPSGYKTSTAFTTDACSLNCTTPATPATATISNVGQTTANVSWSAGNPAGSPTVTYYWVIGTSPTVTYGNGIDEGTTTSTSATAKGFACGTQYYLRVYAQSSCNGTPSGYKTSTAFTTDACSPNCTTPATPATATVSNVGQTTANVSWIAGNPAGSPTVTYYWVIGTSPTVAYGNGIDEGTTTSTSATAKGFVCGTQYYLRVYAQSSCNGTPSGYKTSTAFTTDGCSPNCTTPATPATATISNVGQTTANVSWIAGNPAGSPTVTYYWVIGTSPTVTYGNGIDEGTTTSTSASAKGLACGTQYYLRVYAQSSCNGTPSGYKTSTAFTTDACSPNCTTPATPATATVSNVGQTTANVSWSAGNPAGSPTVTYYWVIGTSPTVTYGNGIDEGTTTSTSASAKGLACGTRYYLRVYAQSNCNGTPSGYKTSTAFTTDACSPNCTTPATPATATVSNVGPTTANVSWSTGSPAGSPTVSYHWVIGTSPTVTYGNGIDEGTTTSTSASAKGLACGTRYYLRVYAQSSCNGTPSGYKTSTAFTTDACSPNCTTPATPATATVSNVGQTTANVSWSTGSPAGSPTVSYHWVIGKSPTVTYGNGVDEGTTTSTSASASGLTCGTQYFLRVYAQSSCNGTPSGYKTSTAFNTATCNSTPSITIQSSSVIPPWQREDDELVGQVNASFSNIPVGGVIQLDIYVNGNYVKSTSHWTTNISSGTHQFVFNVPASSLSPKPINGSVVSYQLIYNPTSTNADVVQRTKIIEKKWDKENIVLFNEIGQTFKMPLKYIPSTKYVQVSFCTENFEICPRSGGGASITLPTPTIVSTSSLYQCRITPNFPCNPSNTAGNFCQQIDLNSGYFTLLVGNDNNLNDVQPGEFKYSISYYDNNYQLISVGNENGYFELAKIGKVDVNTNNRKAIVFIGGLKNTIEKDIRKISNIGNSSEQSWSISKYPEWASKGFDTWYIAQNGVGYTQRNAFSIGQAIDKILSLKSTYNEIDIVSHSKGGLEVRALMSGFALSFKNFSNSYYDFGSPTASFRSFKFSSKLKKVLFLGTPHNGTGTLSLISTLSYGYSLLGIDKNECLPLNSSPAVKELTRVPGYGIINILRDVGTVPIGVTIANLTGYRSYISASIFYNYNNYVNDFTDGVVPGWSSDGIYLLNTSGIHSPVKQLYQHSPKIYLHSSLHTNYGLSLQTSSKHSSLNCIYSPFSSNLDKIVAFFNGNSPYDYTTPFTTCLQPSMSSFSSQNFASFLSGALISRKLYGESRYYKLGLTGENGEFSGSVIPAFQMGDSLKIEASGKETMNIKLDSNIILLRKMPVAMLDSRTSNNKIKYPSLVLVNQKPITSTKSINIAADGQNIIKYEINEPLNQDSVFVPLSMNNHNFSVQLETGYNFILVRFIGQQDTITLGKEVYYYSDSLMTQSTYAVSIKADSRSIGSKVYVNNKFIKQINSFTDTIPVLLGKNEISFSKFGYIYSLITVDSASTINLSQQLSPLSYSSRSSSTIDFSANGEIQYHKTVTLMDSARKSRISVTQIDDLFPGMALIPKSRKFGFKHLNSNWSRIKFAAILDQTEDLSKENIYLLNMSGTNKFSKIAFNTAANVADYDSTVQKLTYNYINFNNGTTSDEALVIMKKQAPIMKAQTIEMYAGETKSFPIATFVTDPDSIKGDITITSPNQNITSNTSFIAINAPSALGNTTFTLTATHDFLSATQIYTVKVLPPDFYMPTAFTPNNDGKNDLLKPIVHGKLSNYRITVFNRYGQKVFESTDPTKGWDGTINGIKQGTGTYVYVVSHQFEGDKQTETKGTVVLIK